MAPLAIVSVVLGVLSFLCLPILPVIPAIVCGHLALSKINNAGGAFYGKGIAIVGLIVGYLAIPWAVLQVWFLVGMFQGESHRLHDLAIEKKEITSDDGKLKVTASGFWVKTPGLSPLASLQMSNKREELYLMVISDSKSDLGDLTLEQHHQHSRDMVFQRMSNVTAT
ncbi:MAG TPA: DUF4190 domain-containing protein, partial [Chthoniobacterales bacterium]